MIGVTEKSGKNNLDANTDRAREKYVKSKRCLRILPIKNAPIVSDGEINQGVKSTACLVLLWEENEQFLIGMLY